MKLIITAVVVSLALVSLALWVLGAGYVLRAAGRLLAEVLLAVFVALPVFLYWRVADFLLGRRKRE